MTILDAYAVVGFLVEEPVAGEVEDLLPEGTLSAANAAEVVDRLVRLHSLTPDDVEAELAALAEGGLRIVEVGPAIGLSAGKLRARHYHRERRPVSLADCLAAATALARKEPLATADPSLAALVREEGGTVIALPDSAGHRP